MTDDRPTIPQEPAGEVPMPPVQPTMGPRPTSTYRPKFHSYLTADGQKSFSLDGKDITPIVRRVTARNDGEQSMTLVLELDAALIDWPVTIEARR